MTQSRADEPPDKVLAAAAAKILDLSGKIEAQGKVVGQIQTQTAWRSIDEKTQQRMVAELKSMGPHKIDLTLLSASMDQEAYNYGIQIIAILKSAGWLPSDYTPNFLMGASGGPIEGIHIGAKDQIGVQAAQVFAGVLDRHQIPYLKGVYAPFLPPANVCEVMVGSRSH